jgi:hypothetical protein
MKMRACEGAGLETRTTADLETSATVASNFQGRSFDYAALKMTSDW